MRSWILLLQADVFILHTFGQLPFMTSAELGFSFALQILIVLFFSGDLSDSGDQFAAPCLSASHLLSVRDSTLFTCTTSFFSPVHCFLLPSYWLSSTVWMVSLHWFEILRGIHGVDIQDVVLPHSLVYVSIEAHVCQALLALPLLFV